MERDESILGCEKKSFSFVRSNDVIEACSFIKIFSFMRSEICACQRIRTKEAIMLPFAAIKIETSYFWLLMMDLFLALISLHKSYKNVVFTEERKKKMIEVRNWEDNLDLASSIECQRREFVQTIQFFIFCFIIICLRKYYGKLMNKFC